MKKFLAVEEIREDLEGNDWIATEDAYPDLDNDEYETIMLESERAIYSIDYTSEVMHYVSTESDPVVLENPGQYTQQLNDDLKDKVTNFFNKIRNPVNNLFSGVDRIIKETDKLQSRVTGLTTKEVADKSAVVGSNKLIKLRSKGSLPKSASELIDELEELLAVGEWLENEYTDGLEKMALSFINTMRDKDKRRWWSHKAVVDYFLESYAKDSFPIPPGTKDKMNGNKLFKEYTDKGILGNSQVSALILDLSKVNNFVEGWERIEMINKQYCKVESYTGDVVRTNILETPVPTKAELLKILDLNEQIVQLSKRLTNEIKSDRLSKLNSRIATSFQGTIDFITSLGMPVVPLSSMITDLRRSLVRFAVAYLNWSTNTYSSYTTNAYQVGKDVNKYVALATKHYR